MKISMRNTVEKDFRPQGLAGLLLQVWNNRHSTKAGPRQIELLETLPLAGRRRLILVRCGGERFLVGGSMDSIETIVKISAGDGEFLSQDGLNP